MRQKNSTETRCAQRGIVRRRLTLSPAGLMSTFGKEAGLFRSAPRT